MSKLKKEIMNRINEKHYCAFTSFDFIDIDNYKAVSKALERLDDEEIIKRIRRGVYYRSKYNDLLGIDELLDINEIVLAIARQLNIIIIPLGNYALNITIYQLMYLQNICISSMVPIMNMMLETTKYILNI